MQSNIIEPSPEEMEISSAMAQEETDSQIAAPSSDSTSDIEEGNNTNNEDSNLTERQEELKRQLEAIKLEEELIAKKKDELKKLSDEIQKRQFQADQLDSSAHALLAAVEEAKAAVLLRETDVLARETAVTAQEASVASLQEKVHALQSTFEAQQAQREEELTQKLASLQAECDSSISKKRIQAETDLASEIAQMKSDATTEISEYLTKLREDGFAALDAEISKARTTRLKSLEDEMTKRRADLETSLKEAQTSQDEAKKQLEELQKELKQRADELDRREQEFAFKEAKLQRALELLKNQEQQLNSTVEQAVAERQQTMDAQIKTAQDEAERLRRLLAEAQTKLGMFKDFQSVWGGNPEEFHVQLSEMQQKIEHLEAELATRPQVHLIEDYQTLKKQYDELISKYRALSLEKKRFDDTELETSDLRRELEIQQEQVKALEFANNEYKARCEEYRIKLERYTHPENAPMLYEERVAEIRQPYLRDIPHQDEKSKQPENEIEWLTHIANSCDSYGISFPRRILYAFHTALKIADWSSITVLAGVSGTGKSELPRLYSIFGGVNFISVPVQPNWDSQESMLGYFNSIDNRFDAQPLLRFLVQCTNTEKNVGVTETDLKSGSIVPDVYPHPLGKYVAIVLLDEMNLAHVEHYFADFLSKLESRRGLGRGKEPEIEVKLGAGCEPYHLKLRRNVLFVGTMNQDETTKSLSDKVLDRGIVIHFPRPTSLNSRIKMSDLSIGRSNTLLQYATWSSWCKRETGFNTEALSKIITQFKHVVEGINDQLELSGRAIGHRVWQSIEYYIANYPTVIANMPTDDGELSPQLIEAMKTAFEDQIVQKVMPKLRGIETRGEGGRQLEAIKQILFDNGFENLMTDFDNARKRGYGQFLWNSAHYLDNEDDSTIN